MRLLFLLLMPLVAIGQPLNFAWDNATNPVGTTTELLINGVTYPGYTGTNAIIDVPVTPGQSVDAKARAIPPTGWQCLLNPAQDITLCHDPYQVSTPECPLKLCEPSVYSNQVLVTNPADPSNVYATKTWTGFDPVEIAPAFIGEYETVWNTATSPKTVSIPVQTGDVLVAYAAHENATGARILNVAGGGLVWTLQQSLTTNGYAETDIWTATAASNQTMTVSFTGSNGYFGGDVLLFRGSSGIGASIAANSGTPSISLATTKAKSAIVFITSDWNAADGTARTWRNSAVETSYFRDSARYTVYGSFVSNIGAIGIHNVGLNNTSLQKYSNIAIEVKGN